MVVLFGFGGAGEQAACVLPLLESGKVSMLDDMGEFMVIEAGSAQPFIFQGKTQWLDQMKLGTGIGTQTDDVTGVGRNFRLKQRDMQHDKSGFVEEQSQALTGL